MGIFREVEPDQVRLFQRAQHAKARAEALLTTSSIASASQTPAATSAIASRFSACCRRLPMKPGMSR
jgi:hypothetical protein